MLLRSTARWIRVYHGDWAAPRAAGLAGFAADPVDTADGEGAGADTAAERLREQLLDAVRRASAGPVWLLPPTQPLAARTARVAAVLRRRGTTPGGGPCSPTQTLTLAACPVHNHMLYPFTCPYIYVQPAVLQALPHVEQLGWGRPALVAAARDLGLSPAAAGALPGGAAALPLAAVARYNRQLAGELAAARDLIQQQQEQQQEQEQEQAATGQTPSGARPEGEGDRRQQQSRGRKHPAAAVAALAAALAAPDPAVRLGAALRRRLELGVAPHIDSWPQALALLAAPAAAPAALRALCGLADEALGAAGDGAVDLDWYAKRGAAAGVYAATELFMLTDFSPVRDGAPQWPFGVAGC
jgi:ubiquinone biosynthesis protein COQ9